MVPFQKGIERDGEPTRQYLSSDYWWDWHGSSDWHTARMTSCCQWAILCFCSSQGRTKQTVTLSHANLLFSSDTAIYRLQLWIPRLHTSTRALSSLGRETNISEQKQALMPPFRSSALSQEVSNLPLSGHAETQRVSSSVSDN